MTVQLDQAKPKDIIIEVPVDAIAEWQRDHNDLVVRYNTLLSAYIALESSLNEIDDRLSAVEKRPRPVDELLRKINAAVMSRPKATASCVTIQTQGSCVCVVTVRWYEDGQRVSIERDVDIDAEIVNDIALGQSRHNGVLKHRDKTQADDEPADNLPAASGEVASDVQPSVAVRSVGVLSGQSGG